MTTTTKHNRFEGGRAGSTYICAGCGKRTRETGEGESGVELCKKCFVIASQENSHSDNHDGRMADCAECKHALASYGYEVTDDRWCDKEVEAPVEAAPEREVLVASPGPKRLTCKAVTKAIREAGLNGELVRGNGYYYFVGPAFESCKTTMVITHHIAAYTLEEWVAEAKKLDLESLDAVKRDALAATGATIEPLDVSKVVIEEVGQPEAPVDLRKTFALKVYEIEHNGDLDDALQAFASVGCEDVSAPAETVDFEDSESAIVRFRTTMALSEVKALLAHTNVVL